MKDAVHHKRELKFLILLLLMFLVIFFIAFLDFQQNVAIMGVLPPKLEDGFIMGFSFIALGKVVWHILKW